MTADDDRDGPREPAPPAVRVSVARWRESTGASETVDDLVVAEAPLEIRFGGRSSTVLMRTPGHDDELVLGFLFTEGLIGARDDLRATRRPDGLAGDEVGNVIECDLAPLPDRAPAERLFVGSSSCGVCGKNSIQELAVRAPPIDARVDIARGVLRSLPERLRAAQPTFSATGGLHGVALFDMAGALLVAREDVGRHNAVDKVIGRSLARGEVPLSERVLAVSGRAGYEIVQKAIAAGIPIVAAVGAPSSLAVRLADEFHVTLIGFLRRDAMNVYTHAERVRA